MAATLIHIKSKMLLPRPETAADVEGEEEDPRDALVRRLLEHQKFKAAAELLHEREQLRAAQWQRPDERVAADRRRRLRARARSRSVQPADRVPGGRAARQDSARRSCCRPEQIPVEVRIEQLLERLSETEACGFEDLFADVDERSGLIVDVPGAARDDSFEAGQGVPVRQLRPDSRVQASAPGRCAASDWRPGGASWLSRQKRTDSRNRQQSTRRTRTNRRRARISMPKTSPSLRKRRLRRPQTRMPAPLLTRLPKSSAALDAEAAAEEFKRPAAELKAIVEALIFASPEPLTPKALVKLLDNEPKEEVLAALDELKTDYERPGGLQLVEVAGGFQIVTRPDLHEWVRRLFHERSTQKLSAQALESLAVIAYRQPITVARDHRDPRRQHVRRAEHAARASPDQDCRTQAGGRAGRSCTRRPRSS